MSNLLDAKISVICGGVGAARFLLGLLDVVAPHQITAIVNTGDDAVLNGLSISPDLDTVVYTTAGAIDPDRGWGLAGESWQALDALRRYEGVRPEGSTAATTWFGLGDRDLATHLYRTNRLGEGATLTEITAEIATAWGLEFTVLPMADERLSTVLTVGLDGGPEKVSFQDYFVRLQHSVPVHRIDFDSDGAILTASARTALETADVVVIAPSNPLVSIGPIRALPGVDELLAERRESVVAVSPIVGGAALKGPADRMLTELGHTSTVGGVAAMYAPIARQMVIDPVDEDQVEAVRDAGVEPIVWPSVMSSPERAASLAAATIGAVITTA